MDIRQGQRPFLTAPVSENDIELKVTAVWRALDGWRRSARLSRRRPRPPIQADTNGQRRQNLDDAPRRSRHDDRNGKGNGAHRAATREAASVRAMMARRLVERVPGGVVGAVHKRLVERPYRALGGGEPTEYDREQGYIGREHRDPRLHPSFAPCCHGNSGRCRIKQPIMDLDHGRRS